jgi:hypothetical protein
MTLRNHRTGGAAAAEADFERSSVVSGSTSPAPVTGHLTDSVFRRYDIVSDGDLKDAARRLDDAAQQQRRSEPASKVRQSESSPDLERLWAA